MLFRDGSRWLVLAIAVLLPVGLFISSALSKKESKDLETSFPSLSALVRTLHTIDTFYVDEVDMDKLLKQGTRRLVSSLDAISRVELAGDDQKQAPADVGLNFMLRNGAFVVISKEKGSPSDESELQPGDILLALNDDPVIGLTLDELNSLLRGQVGSEITLTLSNSEFAVKKVTLTRQTYIPVPASASVEENGIIVFRCCRFTDGTAKVLKEALVELRGVPLTGIILDLRDNIGREVRDICSRLVRSGPLYTLFSREVSKPVQRDDSVNAIKTNVPVVVIINRQSVGEAEVLSACLRGHRIARLVGEASFGFALWTECIMTTDNTKVILATSEIRGPFGRKIHNVGLTPDIVVHPEKGADPQLEEARKVILNWAPIEEEPAEKKAA